MQPIIRRTVTITITESWTITWQDGQETSWQETQEIVWPAVNEADELLPPFIDHEESDGASFDPDAADAVEDE